MALQNRVKLVLSSLIRYYKYFNNKRIRMLSIGCMVENEDYVRLKSIIKDETIPRYFTYTLTVKDASKAKDSSSIKVYVIELTSANLAIGFTLPNIKKLAKELLVAFTASPDAQRPNPEYLRFKCEFSDNQRKANYDGSNLEKLEYIGTWLEKTFEKKTVMFYLFDYQGIGNT